MTINIKNNNKLIDENEINAYKKRGMEKYGRSLTQLDIDILDDEVELTYHIDSVPFERIRRITGYLVGTLERWNDAKRQEERNRVKHEI